MEGQNMELTNDQMQQLRQVELNILRTFIKVCDELHLRYFIVQGTLLGAVRHHGFIPWDDDIDVGMLRKDYNTFLEKAPALLPEYYFLQSHLTDTAYPQCFAKIRDSRTAFVETAYQDLPMNHGIYIDVFPFDFYPDSIFTSLKIDLKKILLRYRVRCCLCDPVDNGKSLCDLLKRMLKRCSKLLYPSLEKAKLEQCTLYERIPPGKNLINSGSPWGKRERIPAAWLHSSCTLSFEEICVSAPKEYDKYLSHVYGDYMTLPREELRQPHHYISALDFEHSYTPH